MTKDYYQILGLTKNATKEEIKKAYFKLAKQYHPDANPNSKDDKVRDEKFKEITNAYNTLSDDRQKSEYDNRANGNAFGTNFTSEDFRDIFGSSFHRQAHTVNLHINKEIRMDINTLGRKKIEYTFINYDDNNKTDKGSITIDFFPFETNGLGYEVRYDQSKQCQVLVGSYQFQGRGHIQYNRVGSLYINYIIELPLNVKIENGCDIVQECEVSLHDVMFGLEEGIVVENIHKTKIKIKAKNDTINSLSSINLPQKNKGLYRNGRFGDYVYRLKIRKIDLNNIDNKDDMDKLRELVGLL